MFIISNFTFETLGIIVVFDNFDNVLFCGFLSVMIIVLIAEIYGYETGTENCAHTSMLSAVGQSWSKVCKLMDLMDVYNRVSG